MSRAASKETTAFRDYCVERASKTAPSRKVKAPIRQPRTAPPLLSAFPRKIRCSTTADRRAVNTRPAWIPVAARHCKAKGGHRAREVLTPHEDVRHCRGCCRALWGYHTDGGS